jgi:hypothetical protein
MLSACATWPTEYRVEESTWIALHTADALQTAQIEHTPGVYESESAWILGREPSHKSVALYFAAAAAGHLAITDYLIEHHWPPWTVRMFEAVTIADSARCVVGNARIGIHF